MVMIGQGDFIYMKKLFVLLLSTVCIGIGINMFLIPSHLINGGVFGVSLLIKYHLELSSWTYVNYS